VIIAQEQPSVLILDDEAAIGEILTRIAQRSGWTARAATTVGEFQALFRSARPDSIMLDLKLNASDGVEQLRFLQGESYNGSIVLMSGVADRVLTATGELGRSLGLAVVGTLSKPASNDHIKDLLATLARYRPLARAPTNPRHHAFDDAEPLSAARLDVGLSNGELSLDFQPIVNGKTGAVEVLEALVRWQHPTRGLVMPDAFIPLAEQEQVVIDRLTLWVVRSAGDQALRLRERGLPSTIAVNVSAANLRDLDFPDRLLDVVTGLGSLPAAMTLEVTESAATGDPTITKDILTRLRLKGFRLAMDDFGTGFSSLKALLNSPFSELKIDQSFVAAVLTSRDARAIVKSTAHLAQDLGLKTVAEGVESQDVVDQLIEFGVDSIQGYYISRPLTASSLPSWLADRPNS
jgi:EAL domain-containing protein (putative c-di-GMP-specific phosphodiesterase class I)/ActR/RegA family two-component response regulator